MRVRFCRVENPRKPHPMLFVTKHSSPLNPLQTQNSTQYWETFIATASIFTLSNTSIQKEACGHRLLSLFSRSDSMHLPFVNPLFAVKRLPSRTRGVTTDLDRCPIHLLSPTAFGLESEVARSFMTGV